MRRSVMLHNSRICADGRLLWLVFVLGALVLVLALATTAAAATAYFSLVGDFINAGDQHDFYFDLIRPVASPEELRFETFANGGGTNAAGAAITSGGIDSLLELFDSASARRGFDDDGSFTAGTDSLLSWPGLAEIDHVPLNPDPLPADSYRLNLSEFGNDDSGHWALDLIGPADAIALTGESATGTSMLTSLKFGTTTSGVSDGAILALSSGKTVVLFGSGELSVANTGKGTLHLDGASVTANETRIGNATGSSGTLLMENSATATINGSMFLGWSDMSSGAGTINNSTLTVSAPLYVGVDGNSTMDLENGGQVSNTVGWLGFATNSTGDVTVDGFGSSWTNSVNLNLGDSVASGVGTLAITEVGSPGGRVYVGDGARTIAEVFLSSSQTALVVSDDPLNADGGGNVNVYNRSSLINAGLAYLGLEVGETGAALVDGMGSSWTNAGELYVGFYGDGALNITNGGQVSNSLGLVGWIANGTGDVTVDGQGSSWTNSGDLYLGDTSFSGVGTLTLSEVASAGSRVYVGDAAKASTEAFSLILDSYTVLTVSDDPLHGDGGGNLKIYNGSSLDNAGFAILGMGAGETGTALVNGMGSTWTNVGDLYVGFSGDGTLNIADGGQVSNDFGFVAASDGTTGEVTVDGIGSRWIISQTLFVGHSGDGRLDITAGGQVSSGSANVGFVSTGAGVATVDGLGSVWESAYNLTLGDFANSGVGSLTLTEVGSTGARVYVGDAARVSAEAGLSSQSTALIVSDDPLNMGGGGHLSIYNGSSLDNAGIAVLGMDAGETGTALVEGVGSTWTNTESLYVGYRDTGTLTIVAGGNVTVLSDAYAAFFSTGGGAITVSGDESRLTVSGDLEIGDGGIGTMFVEAGGWVDSSGVGTFGRDVIGDDLNSDGTVTITGASTTDPSRWDTDDLIVGNNGTGTLHVVDGGVVHCNDVQLGLNGTGIVNVGGLNSLWQLGGLTVGAGANGPGAVNLTDQAHVESGSVTVGTNASNGFVTIDGFSTAPMPTRAQWDVTGSLDVGSTGLGDGTVAIENAGLMTVAQDVHVFGSMNASGKLTVQTGGRLDVAGQIDVDDYGTVELLGGTIAAHSFIVDPGGAFTHEDGTLTVDGGILAFPTPVTNFVLDGATASDMPVVQLTNGATATHVGIVVIGDAHRGRLEILDGSQFAVSGAFMLLGDLPGSHGEVVVAGQGSQLTTDQEISIGEGGPGVLRILGGGYVTDVSPPFSPIGWEPVGGSVEVSGKAPDGTPSNWTTHGEVRVGIYGPGELAISAGAQVNALNDAAIALGMGSDGSHAIVTDLDSRWNIAGSLFVGGDTSTAGGAGKLTVANEAQVIAGSVKVWQPGTVELDGGIISTASLELAGGALRGTGSLILPPPGSLYNSGLVAPGLSAGVIDIVSGDYVQDAAGTLAIEIGGRFPSQYDQLHIVSGSATLAGTLEVSLIDNAGGSNVFMPAAGDAFDILDWNSRSGEFNTLVLPPLTAGLMWNASQLYTAGVLGVFLAGDYNQNGVVDAADYTVWRDSLGQMGVGLAADGDNTGASAGRIDQADYIVWKSNFGAVAGSGSAANANSAVPEPATLLLLTLAAARWSLRRGRAA